MLKEKNFKFCNKSALFGNFKMKLKNYFHVSNQLALNCQNATFLAKT